MGLKEKWSRQLWQALQLWPRIYNTLTVREITVQTEPYIGCVLQPLHIFIAEGKIRDLKTMVICIQRNLICVFLCDRHGIPSRGISEEG